MKMKDIDLIKEVLDLVIFTGKVKNEKPVSLLMSARVERGKTEILKQYVNVETVYISQDLTAFGLNRDIIPKIERGEVTHIIIPDLLQSLSRRHETVAKLITYLNALVEEGLFGGIHTYANTRYMKKGQPPIYAGLISAIPPEPLYDKRRRWTSIGFMSRMIPLTYEYSKESQKRIRDSIKNGDYEKSETVRLNLPVDPRDVKCEKRFVDALDPIVDQFIKAQELWGFRYTRQLRTLLKASALKAGRSCVNHEDVRKLTILSGWMNFDFNMLPSKPSALIPTLSQP